jgi:Uma2 family endonuclease
MLATTDLHRFTVDQFQALAATGVLAGDARLELIGGLIVDMSPIGADHAYLVDRIGRAYLWQYPVDAPAEAPFVRVQQPIQATDTDQLVPDLSLVRGPPERYRSRLPGPDEILAVVEVADTTLRRDTGEKLAAYQAAGVGIIHVVDVRGQRVLTWTWVGGVYVPSEVRGDDEWLHGPDLGATLLGL